MRDPELQQLLDKQAIHEVVLRYCRGIDRMDRELVRDCYWPEATDEHGSFVGTRDEYVAWVFDRMLPRYEMTMHFIGNVLVHVDAARAKSEAYGFAMHRSRSDKLEHNLRTGFRYVDDFERRDGEWRIARRICTLEWTLHVDPSRWFDAPESHRRGQRDRTDAVYWPLHGDES
jgi:SnoaL-like domain